MLESFFHKSSFFLVVIVVVLLTFSVFLYFKVRRDSLDEEKSSDEVFKILFVIEDEGVPISTNIIAFYPKTKRAIMFDVPNNTGMILDELGRTDGISALYKEKGVDIFKKKIERLTGINLPFHIQCSTKNIEYVIDMLGGISIFIPTPVDIESNSKRILLPSGAVLLDGDKAIDYMFYESENDNEGDACSRKQKLLIAVFRKN